MGFSQPFSEARSIIEKVQKNKVDGSSGMGSSPVRDGASDPGVSTPHPSEELKLRRTSEAHVAQKSLRRKYASTGSGGGKG